MSASRWRRSDEERNLQRDPFRHQGYAGSPEELSGKTSLLGRLFGAKHKNNEQLVEKYTRVGIQLDTLWARLKGCEDDLNRLNERLFSLFDENTAGLAELERYIAAGEEAIREMDAYLLASPCDPAFPAVQKAREGMHSRLIALCTAETAALQTFPMLKMMIRRNLDLTRTIDSAFIAALPAFRQQLAAAIAARRQEIEAEAMRALLGREARAIPAADASRTSALETSLQSLRKGLDEAKQLLR